MLELEVLLDYMCCVCQHPVGVTLKCEGQRLDQELNTVTSIKIPCPTCGGNNEVTFTPGGQLVRVAPEAKAYAIPEPSCN